MFVRGLLAVLVCASRCVKAERLGVSLDDDDLDEDTPGLPNCTNGVMHLSGVYKVTTKVDYESCTIRGENDTTIDLGQRLYFKRNLRLEGNIVLLGHSLFRDMGARCLEVEGSLEFAGNMTFLGCGTNSTNDGGAALVGHNITFAGGGQVRFENCSAQEGGCLFANGQVRLNKGTADFRGAWANDGGAIYAKGGFVQTGGSVIFHDCHAAARGGAIFLADTLSQSGGKAVFDNCSAGSDGGAMHTGGLNKKIPFVQSGGSMSFSNCKASNQGGAMIVNALVQSAGSLGFVNCTSDEIGGALYVRGSCLQSGGEMKFQHNRAGQNGGAAFIFSWVQSGGRASFTDSESKNAGSLLLQELLQSDGEMTFQQSWAQFTGGAIKVRTVLNQTGGTVTFTNCSAGEFGGALHLGQLSQTGGQFTFDTCWTRNAGGALHAESLWKEGSQEKSQALSIDSAGKLSFRNCSSALVGGAIRALGIKIVGSSSFDNCSSGSGGAILDLGSSHLVGTVFRDVSAPLAVAKGNLSLENVRVDNSSAEFTAAAVSVQNLNCSLGWEGFVDPMSRRVKCSRCAPGRVQVDTAKFTVKDKDSTVTCEPCPQHTERCSSGHLKMQRGTMVEVSNISMHLHCPNPLACPGGDLPSSNISMCSKGYTGPGCAHCETATHGRSDGNLFVCDECPKESKQRVLQMTSYIVKDFGIFAISAYSVVGATARKRSSSVIVDQLMSFGILSGIILAAIAETQAYGLVKEEMSRFATFTAMVELHDAGIGSVDMSTECLLGAAGMPKTLLAAHVVKFLVPALLILGLSRVMGIWLALVIGTNCFLPKFVASLGKYLICYDMVSEREGGHWFCKFSDNAHSSTNVFTVSVIACCFLAGIGLFVKVGLEKTEPQPKYVLYLTSSYKSDFALFEAERLFRKMLLTLTTVLLPISVAAPLQLNCISIIVLSSLVANLFLRPYAVSAWNKSEAVLLSVSMAMVCLASCLISNESYWGHSEQTQRLMVITTISLSSVVSLFMSCLLLKELVTELFRKRTYESR